MGSFVVSLSITLILVSFAVATGFLARRKLHLFFVITGVSSLVITILYAEKLGRSYDLDAAGWITPLHLTIAKLTTLAFLGPIVTGVMTWRNYAHKALHRKLVFLALGMTVLALITGTWMILASPRL